MNTTIENLENRAHWAAKAAAAPEGSPERAELDGIVAEFDSVIAFDAEVVSEELIDAVLDRIVQDVEIGDLTAIAELVRNLDAATLRAYLPDGEFSRSIS
jgi:hypothetical protein